MANRSSRPARSVATAVFLAALVTSGAAVNAAAVLHGPAPGPSSAPTPRAAADQPCRIVYTHSADQEITTGAADDHTTIVVPETGTVADLDVRVNVVHPNDQEVALTLFHGMDAVTFIDGVGGSGDNFEHTILDDEAATALTAGTAPFAGRYMPTASLTAFDGDSVAGEWQMLAKDQSTGPGTLDYWRLILTLTACDLDDDGVDDYSDQCLGLAGPAPSGCPVVERELTLRWGDGRWSGRLSAEARGCRADRAVRVFKVVSGPDRQVASATTADDGTWRKADDRPRGRYYAVSPRVVVPAAGICAAVQTPKKSF